MVILFLLLISLYCFGAHDKDYASFCYVDRNISYVATDSNSSQISVLNRYVHNPYRLYYSRKNGRPMVSHTKYYTKIT